MTCSTARSLPSRALVAPPALPAAAQTTLNVVTAGDQNMVDYVNNYLGPKFEKVNPGVKVRAVGTGPGDAGSQKIYEKLSAQQKAGTAAWDVDVAVVHQRGAATMVKESLLAPYRNDDRRRQARRRATRRRTRSAPNVDGYVHADVPQPDRVRLQPRRWSRRRRRAIAELAEWVKKNPKQFGYNGVKGGMSGVGFVMGWVERQQRPAATSSRRARTTPADEGGDRQGARRASRSSTRTS